MAYEAILPKAVEKYSERVVTGESFKQAALNWLADPRAKPGEVGDKSIRKLLDYAQKIANRSLPEDQKAITQSINEISQLLNNICEHRSQGRYEGPGMAQKCAQKLRELVEVKQSVGLNDSSLASVPRETLEAAKRKPNNNASLEYARYMFGYKHYSFNVLVSDKLGPKRRIKEDAAHERCSLLNYNNIELTTSMVIIYHNEAFSVLVRMINGILDSTPQHILAEIILYDDFSDQKLAIEPALKQYAVLEAWDSQKIKFFKSAKREGLIRAKVYASRLATADVLVFLDSHCEFEYSKAMVTKGTFDWSLKFKWDYFEWSHFDDKDNYVRPFKTVAMSGGLLAVDRDYFKQIGEYDEGMEIWGAENIEMSIRVWLCGGSVLVAPCSRVGHVFRMRRPYTGKPGVDTNLYNSKRTVEVWFDDYKKYFYKKQPLAVEMSAGDLTQRVKLKESLSCNNFSWFVEHIHKDLKPTEQMHKSEL
uniref:Uncharacterized protein n=1 Tax=Ditylenchus dipsaci TaxID=166011 RepID=A0A915DIQ3_9BILA